MEELACLSELRCLQRGAEGAGQGNPQVVRALRQRQLWQMNRCQQSGGMSEEAFGAEEEAETLPETRETDKKVE